MSELTPFFDSKLNKVEFLRQARPTITVENSTFCSSLTCGIINSAVGKIEMSHKRMLSNEKIKLLNDFCYIIVSDNNSEFYQKSNIAKMNYLCDRMRPIW